MNTRETREYLVKNALRVHGCADGVMQLSMTDDNQEMLQVFIDRIDFCLAKNSPSKDELKRLFPDIDLKKKGFYIDEKATVMHDLIKTLKTIILGHSYIVYIASGYSVSRLYIKQNAKVRIIVTDKARVMVDALDNASVFVESECQDRVVVNLYANATCRGNANVIIKNKATYDL